MRTMRTDIVPGGKGGENTLFPYCWVITGMGEGKWWKQYSWWVIPLGLILISTPYLFLFGVFGDSNGNQRTPHQRTTPVVIQQPAQIVPAYQPAAPVTVTQTVTVPPQKQEEAEAPEDKPAAESRQQTIWGVPTTSPH